MTAVAFVQNFRKFEMVLFKLHRFLGFLPVKSFMQNERKFAALDSQRAGDNDIPIWYWYWSVLPNCPKSLRIAQNCTKTIRKSKIAYAFKCIHMDNQIICFIFSCKRCEWTDKRDDVNLINPMIL